MKISVGVWILLCAMGAGPANAQPLPDVGGASGLSALLGPPQAVQMQEGRAPVTPANTWRGSGTGTFLVELAPDLSRRELPVVDPSRIDPAAQLLRRLYASGRAAGLWDVVYDNRDRGHSVLPPASFPQINRTAYAPAFTIDHLDYGLAGQFRFGRPVIGNSSTAMTSGILARSLGRIALRSQADAIRGYQLYASNQLYVYPEHRDHDPGTGDRFFANTPYFVMSQGSSGSDRPFLEALATIYASYTPETRQRLEELQLLGPTTQMILRRSRTGIDTAQDYLSAKAHPTAFNADTLQPLRMVERANALTPETIPPMVRLRVQEDLQAVPGRDYLALNLDEKVFTTPSAIARVWRSFAYSRVMTISAESTTDPNGRDLTFHWVLLGGDPARVEIVPQNRAGTVASITITFQGAGVVDTTTGLTSTRIDIGVFADNGISLSAPAMLSIDFPVYQNRQYSVDRNGTRFLTSLNYLKEKGDAYADPTLWPTAPWRDAFLSDHEGGLTSLRRTYPDGKTQDIRVGGGQPGLEHASHAADQIRHKAIRLPKGNLQLEMLPPEITDRP